MFDIFANLLCSIASFLFPLFASYKALKTSDPAQLTPWLMYWVVLSILVLVESWTEWILIWVPFYAWIRFFFLLYLVLPQTQGARLIYEEYIFPKLEENETAIEEFIASSHERLKAAGLAYLKQAIEYVKTNILGFPPTAQAAPPPQAQQTPQSYTQSLLARFTYPAARSPSTGNHLSSDFYSFLASAVSAATTSPAANPPTPTSPSAPAPTATWTSLIPDAIRTAGSAARMSYIRTQRERLNVALSALDREEEAAKRDNRQSSMNEDGDGYSSRGNPSPARSVGGQSGASGLSKSRSEQDFEKLEAESGDEDGTGLHRRRPGVTPSQSSGWIPWGWGSGGGGGGGAAGGGDASRSSGVENH
ncbi:TB2/DP1, HVA22 family-domain-containing protein [Podospora australis]|uniref:Protein YOP1 n=1 Tax=Podospora australis TaxID=1536484 RepID=A0AAN6WRG8_9PEZI|nr:TB2/DP1, HVA22 family-domain-containing protein [Podospora australis]